MGVKKWNADLKDYQDKQDFLSIYFISVNREYQRYLRSIKDIER